MYRAVCICFDDRGKPTADLLEKYDNHIPTELRKYVRESVLPLPFLSFAYSEAIRDADSMGMRYRLRSLEVMSKAEIESAAYYIWTLPQHRVYGEPDHWYETKYRNFCPKCGEKSDPIDVVYADRTTLNKLKIADLYPNIVLNTAIRRLFEEAGFDGISFDVRVADRKGNIDEDFRVMRTENILPPVNSGTWLFEDDFRWENSENACGHEVYYLRSDLYYDRASLSEFRDFNRTHEILNNFQERYLVVSAAVRTLMKKNKLHIGRFTPVIFE